MKKILSCLTSLIISVVTIFPINITTVFAFGSNWENSGLYYSIGGVKGNYNNKGYTHLAFCGSQNAGDIVNGGGLLFYKGNSDNYTLLVYSFESGKYLFMGASSNNLTYTYNNGKAITSTYTANGEGNVTGTTVYYTTVTQYYSKTGTLSWSTAYEGEVQKIFGNVPVVNAPSMSNDNLKNAILAFLCLDSEYYPWDFSTSSGGYHWSDGVSINAENKTLYDNVYLVMDSNNDNSVTQEEVNYYNYTYNTNYDYSAVNNDNDFNQMEFLYYVALKLMENENPAGDGSGGGAAGGTAGGITVTDSFTQSQTQSIAENAVNVTINNDGSINNDNSQFINSVINNNLAGEGAANAFETALGTVSSFVNVGQSFASLASAVLGFLPAWVTTLLSLMFTLLFVMVVFRLIHLFI